MLDVEEYAKQMGIPLGAIPVEAFKKAQSTGVTIRQPKGASKAEAFTTLCTDTQALLDECAASRGGAASGFPAACTDVGVKHMECLFNKRDIAYQTAQTLVGKEAAEKVLPYYQENQKKAMEMIEVYKANLAGDKLKKDVFWG